jgi:allophanate hydrolase-like protein
MLPGRRPSSNRRRPLHHASPLHCRRDGPSDGGDGRISLFGGSRRPGEIDRNQDRRPARRPNDAHLVRRAALAGTAPPKPGLLRVAAGTSAAVAVELWALSASAFGRFVAAVPPPLSIGTLRLTDGRDVKGFLVEAAATEGAHDISRFGGWRAYMASLKVPA